MLVTAGTEAKAAGIGNHDLAMKIRPHRGLLDVLGVGLTAAAVRRALD